MSPTLPKYVEYGPRETAPPAFVSAGGNLLGLLLTGDKTAIMKLCNRVLNKPFKAGRPPGSPESPFTYKPFSDVVVLFAGRWEGMRSMPLKDRGSANEYEVSLWVLLEKWDDRKKARQELCMMVPYMFVDNPMSLLNGREDYGYQKAYGKFDASPPPGIPSAAPDSVAVEAFGGVFGPQQIADWVNILRVEPVAAGGPHDPMSPPGRGVFPAAELGDMLCKGVNQVFLKQFRDAALQGRACYQHLVEAAVSFMEPRVKLKLGAWRVEIQIPSPSSHPITEDLGVETQVTPLAFELQSGLTLEPGRIIV